MIAILNFAWHYVRCVLDSLGLFRALGAVFLGHGSIAILCGLRRPSSELGEMLRGQWNRLLTMTMHPSTRPMTHSFPVSLV